MNWQDQIEIPAEDHGYFKELENKLKTNKMYKIIGVYKGKKEILDLSESKRDAEYLAGEYRMAYGSEWNISVEKV